MNGRRPFFKIRYSEFVIHYSEKSCKISNSEQGMMNSERIHVILDIHNSAFFIHYFEEPSYLQL